MLAIDGGPKVRETPFPQRHLFGAEERQAALRLFSAAMESGDSIGYSGPEELAYEREFAAFMGGGYVDLVNSGTAALYAALGALKLEAAGEVVIPPITDPGGAMPAALLCQVPVVADAAPGSFNAGAEQIEAVLTPHTPHHCRGPYCRRTSGYDTNFGASRGARHPGHRGLRPRPTGRATRGS